MNSFTRLQFNHCDKSVETDIVALNVSVSVGVIEFICLFSL